MCCGQKVVQKQQDEAASVWVVKDATGHETSRKSSEVAAKLAAARIGGTWEKIST